MKNWPYGVRVAIVIVLMIAAMMLLWCPILCKADTYAMTAVIVSLNYDTDTVKVEDFNGNVWAFDGCEDWQLFDMCALMMDDNNTIDIYDDMIVSIRYNGWLDGWIERVCK